MTICGGRVSSRFVFLPVIFHFISADDFVPTCYILEISQLKFINRFLILDNINTLLLNLKLNKLLLLLVLSLLVAGLI